MRVQKIGTARNAIKNVAIVEAEEDANVCGIDANLTCTQILAVGLTVTPVHLNQLAVRIEECGCAIPFKARSHLKTFRVIE